jgi:hypothetical protein
MHLLPAERAGQRIIDSGEGLRGHRGPRRPRAGHRLGAAVRAARRPHPAAPAARHPGSRPHQRLRPGRRHRHHRRHRLPDPAPPACQRHRHHRAGRPDHPLPARRPRHRGPARPGHPAPGPRPGPRGRLAELWPATDAVTHRRPVMRGAGADVHMAAHEGPGMYAAKPGQTAGRPAECPGRCRSPASGRSRTGTSCPSGSTAAGQIAFTGGRAAYAHVAAGVRA